MNLNFMSYRNAATFRRFNRSPVTRTMTSISEKSEQNDALMGQMSNSRTRQALQHRSNHGSGSNATDLYQRILGKQLNISSRGEQDEREADQLASRTAAPSKQQINTGGSNTGERLTTEPGLPLPENMQHKLGFASPNSLDDIRIHNNREAATTAALLGAEAFTHGKDIFLSDRASLTDKSLMTHEVGHALHNQNMIQRREATWLERRVWLGFFDHYLPKKFLNNYMDDTGNPITLTRKEMEDCNPVMVDIRRSEEFQQSLFWLQSNGGGCMSLSCSQLAGAYTNGTLGNFTVRYNGVLDVDGSTGEWAFNGTMTFHDYWDFNTGGANRPFMAEVKVQVANALLPGSPFTIDSVAVPASQTDTNSSVQWTALTSQHVGDNLLSGGADIAVGGDVGGVSGDVVGGPEVGGAGADVGGEFGGQTNADL